MSANPQDFSVSNANVANAFGATPSQASLDATTSVLDNAYVDRCRGIGYLGIVPFWISAPKFRGYDALEGEDENALNAAWRENYAWIEDACGIPQPSSASIGGTPDFSTLPVVSTRGLDFQFFIPNELNLDPMQIRIREFAVLDVDGNLVPFTILENFSRNSGSAQLTNQPADVAGLSDGTASTSNADSLIITTAPTGPGTNTIGASMRLRHPSWVYTDVVALRYAIEIDNEDPAGSQVLTLNGAGSRPEIPNTPFSPVLDGQIHYHSLG